MAQAVLLAIDFRQRFHRDVVIDLWAYRRHGHNEGDEPAFTQPVMYRAISRKPTLRQLYAEQLVRGGRGHAGARWRRWPRPTGPGWRRPTRPPARIASRPAPPATGGVWARVPGRRLDGRRAAHRRARGAAAGGGPGALPGAPGLPPPPQAGEAAGGAGRDGAGAAAARLGHGRGAGLRHAGAGGRRGCGWWARTCGAAPSATATPCSTTTRPARPTRRWPHLREGQGPVEIRDSLLSEAAALGFEYGYSLDMPEALSHLGGAVRRLRQLRPGDHRPVPLLGRGQVEPALRPGAAPAARHGGAGAGALLGPAGALPGALGGRQLARGQPHHAGADLPRAAAAGRLAATASRWW